MFAKWFEEYRKLSEEWKIVSQLFAFLIALISVLSLYSNTRAGYFNPEYVRTESLTFWTVIAFHVLVALLFSVRFFFLFSKTKLSFWFAQLSWLLGLITLFAWSIFTTENIFGIFLELIPKSPDKISFCLDCSNRIFRNSSDSLETLFLTYFFISPIKQLITFVFAFIKSK